MESGDENTKDWYIFTEDMKIIHFFEKERIFEDSSGDGFKELIVDLNDKKYVAEYCFSTLGELFYSVGNELDNAINSMRIELFYAEQAKRNLDSEFEKVKNKLGY